MGDLNWQIVGAYDVNNDGRSDLVWRNSSTGQDVVWFMNNATMIGAANLPTVLDTHWRIGR